MWCTWIILKPSPSPGLWKNCLLWNWSLVLKLLGTTALNSFIRNEIHILTSKCLNPVFLLHFITVYSITLILYKKIYLYLSIYEKCSFNIYFSSFLQWIGRLEEKRWKNERFLTYWVWVPASLHHFPLCFRFLMQLQRRDSRYLDALSFIARKKWLFYYLWHKQHYGHINKNENLPWLSCHPCKAASFYALSPAYSNPYTCSIYSITG